jgi:hypothetical protein
MKMEEWLKSSEEYVALGILRDSYNLKVASLLNSGYHISVSCVDSLDQLTCSDIPKLQNWLLPFNVFKRYKDCRLIGLILGLSCEVLH